MSRNKPILQINWKLYAGLILSALFLYLAFKKVDFAKTWAIIKSSDFRFLLPAVLVTILQYLIRAWRWKILLIPVKKTGFRNRFLSVLIGFAANCVLPARLGEFIRANSLGQAEKISKSAAFGTLVIERLFDGVVMLLILFLGLQFARLSTDHALIIKSLKGSALLLFCAFITLIVFITGLRLRTDLFVRILGKIFFMLSEKHKNRIILSVENFALGLSPLKGASSWGIVIFWSLILWCLSLVQIQLISISVGITLPFISYFIILSILAMGVMVPSAPGFIGTFHLSVQYGFILFGISAEEGLSAAFLLHASFYIPTIITGVLAFIRMQALYGKIDVIKEAK